MNYEFLTSANIWQGYDAESLPLETSEVRTLSDNGVLTSSYYFTANQAADGKTRCFVKVLRPDTGSNFPTIIVANGINGYSEEDYVSYVREGFAVILFDYSGRTEEKSFFTIYPDSLSYCNAISAGRTMHYAEPSAKHTCWYAWTTIARRVITFAFSLPFVNKDRTGMIGISEGANVMWQTVATDKRISAACAVFAWRRSVKDDCADEAECWEAGVAPDSYLPYVTVPTMVAGGTNRDFSEFSKAGMLANLPKTTPLYFSLSVGLSENMDASDMRSVHSFFSHILNGTSFPTAPTVTVSEKDGRYTISLVAKNSFDADIFYASGDEEEFLNFKRISTQEKNGVYTASVDGLSGEKLYFIGRADFGAFRIAAEPICFSLGTKKTASNAHIVYQSSMGTDTVVPVGKELVFDSPLSVSEGINGIKGISSRSGGFAIWVADTDKKRISALRFDAYAKADRIVRVNALCSDNGIAVKYSCEVAVPHELKWQSCVIDIHDLKSDSFFSPESWQDVKRIEFVCDSQVLINNVLWV